MDNVAEEKSALQWHPAFFAGLQIELAEESHLLEFENEHQLGTKPKEIDVLVIKKDARVPIRKNIGRIFRKYNIIEYKSPEDYLSIDAFYKIIGYACFYKADTQHVDEIKIQEITISYVSKQYPYKLISHLEKEMKLLVHQIGYGIYYIDGLFVPIQLVITSKLSKEENLWLSSLTDELNDMAQAEKLLQDYQKHKNEELYESMMDVIVNANENIFKKEEENMSGALMRIIQDTVDKQVKEQVDKQVKEQVDKKVKEQVDKKVKEQVDKKVKEQVDKQVKDKVLEALATLVKDGLLNMSEAAKSLSLTEEEFLEKLN